MNDLMEMPVKTLEQKQKENEVYLNSPEWKDLLEKASKAVNQSYTVIYRDTNEELKEAWHWLSDLNIEYVKAKYKKQKKEILIFEPMTMEFGARLASIKGGSKYDN
jgi:hypothetical protein